MKIYIDQEQKEDLLREREKRLLKIMRYCMNEGLTAFPASHAKGLLKLVSEYAETCMLLEHTSVEEYVDPTGYLNDP